MNKIKTIAICITAVLLMMMPGNFASAQQSLPESAAFSIKSEAFNHSQVEALSTYMTDLMGSRLAGSQQKLRAEKLVIEKLKELGFSNIRAEKATDFTRGGWDNVKNYVAMTAPYYCSFAANPKAWSGSTQGLVKGECVVINATTEEEFNANYKGKLQGKIALMPATQTYTMRFDPLANRYTEEQLEEMAKDPRPTAARRPAANNNRNAQTFQRSLPALLKAEGAIAVISGRGTFNVPSSTSVSYTMGDPEPLTEIILPIEDHSRMCRIIELGEKVEMEMDIKNIFTENKQINNVIAEIPGSDPKLKDEVVLLGAHFDSWHGSTGAADNASGCIVMMEALRIIKASGIQPRRT
ncbi:MAG: M28 family peptidase, partial [Bacteroidales bacterium]|nr:M28 family peptidase [Bacteroidales bacterium]